MPKLVCGILESRPSGVAEKARDLTISWLRWGYFGRIIAADNVDRILTNAAGGGYDYCLIQSCGHILAERSGVQGSAGVSFFEALERWISQGDFFVAAKVADPGGGLDRRCLLIDLRYYRQSGRPSFESCPPGATFIAESLRRGIPIREFGPEIESYLVDLGPDLDLHPGFLQGLEEQIEKAQRGVFVLNFESYRDVETPPADFTGPVAVLYSVAAGLKPNRILATHGFDQRTEVVYFDYSSAGLAFRRMLLEEWSGRDYPAFLRSSFRRLPPSRTHYYLWHGASPDALDWDEMERLWAAETERWGGAGNFADQWAGYRTLRHDFLLSNLLTAQSQILERIQDHEHSVIWWSNAFSTLYSAWHCTVEQKRRIYESWIRALAERAPRILIYGSDHSNSSVNSTRAREYWEAYRAEGGDPLSERSFFRHRIRF